MKQYFCFSEARTYQLFEKPLVPHTAVIFGDLGIWQTENSHPHVPCLVPTLQLQQAGACLFAAKGFTFF